MLDSVYSYLSELFLRFTIKILSPKILKCFYTRSYIVLLFVIAEWKKFICSYKIINVDKNVEYPHSKHHKLCSYKTKKDENVYEQIKRVSGTY